MILSIGLLILVGAYGVSPWILLLLACTWIFDLSVIALLFGNR